METRRRNTGYSICIRTDTGQRANATSVGTDSGKGTFGKRVNIHGITEYAVVELTQQEVSENFRKRDKGKEMDELPF